MIKFLVFVAGACFALPAHAYLDPGTGSILLQSLIGAVAIGAAAVGTSMGRIRKFFFRRKSASSESSSATDGQDADGSGNGRPSAR